MKSHRFREGDEVAHKENRKQKMFVRALLYETKEISAGHDGEGKSKTENKRFILGVECHWWDADSNLNRDKFHTRELLPWSVAQKKVIEIQEWIDN